MLRRSRVRNRPSGLSTWRPRNGMINVMKAPVLSSELLRFGWKLRPSPVEVSTALDQAFCQRRGRVAAWEREQAEEVLKLQYYFGGEEVAYIPRKDGWDVIAIGDQIKVALGRLPREDREQVILAVVEPWPAETLDVITPGFDENTSPFLHDR